MLIVSDLCNNVIPGRSCVTVPMESVHFHKLHERLVHLVKAGNLLARLVQVAEIGELVPAEVFVTLDGQGDLHGAFR